MLKLNCLHHIAIICTDYEKSKQFYIDVLGFKVKKEEYREERNSYKLDLTLNGKYLIELFSFPTPPKRLSHPEATGLRHIAFEVDDIDKCVNILRGKGIDVESVRVDKITNRKFTFLTDPDDLPIDLYEK